MSSEQSSSNFRGRIVSDFEMSHGGMFSNWPRPAKHCAICDVSGYDVWVLTFDAPCDRWLCSGCLEDVRGQRRFLGLPSEVDYLKLEKKT